MPLGLQFAGGRFLREDPFGHPEVATLHGHLYPSGLLAILHEIRKNMFIAMALLVFDAVLSCTAWAQESEPTASNSYSSNQLAETNNPVRQEATLFCAT